MILAPAVISWNVAITEHILIDLKPALDEETLDHRLQETFQSIPENGLETHLPIYFPRA